DALDIRVLLHRAALAQGFQQVPGDRLALAVRVGGKDQAAILDQRVGDGADVLLALRVDLPLHLEAGLGVDRAVLRGQVADMAVGGEHRVAAAQIGVDRLGLGRGLDHYDSHTALLAGPDRPALPYAWGFPDGPAWPSAAPSC